MIFGQSPLVYAGSEKTPIRKAAWRSTAAMSSVLLARHGIPLRLRVHVNQVIQGRGNKSYTKSSFLNAISPWIFISLKAKRLFELGCFKSRSGLKYPSQPPHGLWLDTQALVRSKDGFQRQVAKHTKVVCTLIRRSWCIHTGGKGGICCRRLRGNLDKLDSDTHWRDSLRFDRNIHGARWKYTLRTKM